MRRNTVIVKAEKAMKFAYKTALMMFFMYFAMYARTHSDLPTFDLPEYALFIIPTFLGMYVLISLIWYDMGVREVGLEMCEDER